MGKKQKQKQHEKAARKDAKKDAKKDAHKDADLESIEAEAPESAAVFVALDRGNQVSSDVLNLLASTSPPAADEAPTSVAPPSIAPPSLSTETLDGDNLDAEASHDIAPIGPTEPGARFLSMPPASMPSPEVIQTPASVDDIEQQIRDLEAKLDLMIGQGKERTDKPAPIPLPRPSPLPKQAAPTDPPPEPEGKDDATASEVLPPEFYARQWGREGLRSRSEEVDDFGLDPAFEAKVQRVIDFLQKYYFRVESRGMENIPKEGRCLIVANHAGGPLPYDGAMLRAAIRRMHPAHREMRWLTEDFVYYLPFVGTLMNRLGAVRACQENAERLLNKEALVAVFPEGAKGIGKLYRDRYRLQRFGRGGFIRLCLRTRTPIVPCAIIGAEEANPMLYRIEYMTKALGIPYFPITPTFPALGALGLIPAPTKWKIQLGEPITWSGYGPEAADDEILVGRLSERVRASIQSMLDRMLAERRSVWLG